MWRVSSRVSFLGKSVQASVAAQRFRALATDAEVIAKWGGMPSSSTEKVSAEGLSVVNLKHEDDGVVKVSLNRPKKYNSMNLAVFEELEECFARIAKAKESVKCVILGAEGPNFCAGIDVAVLLALRQGAMSEKCPARSSENIGNVIKRLQTITGLPEACHAPVIAVTQGLCIGAGVDLITACDLRVCTSDAKFSVKEVDLAIVADLGTLQRLPLSVGEQRARELSYTGRIFSGKEAKEYGLVLDCYASAEEMEREATALAGTIAKKSPVTVRGVKANLTYSRDHSVNEGLDQVLLWNESHLLSRDLEEAFQAVVKQMESKKK